MKTDLKIKGKVKKADATTRKILSAETKAIKSDFHFEVFFTSLRGKLWKCLLQRKNLPMNHHNHPSWKRNPSSWMNDFQNCLFCAPHSDGNSGFPVKSDFKAVNQNDENVP